MQRIFFLLVLFLPLLSVGQNHEPVTLGAGNAGKGFTRLSTLNAFAPANNQAAMAFMEHAEVGVFGQRAFLVEGVDFASFSGVLPTDAGSFGLSASYFGFEAYNEQQFRLAYGRKLARNFSIGASFDMLSTRMAEYGNFTTFTVELSMLYAISDDLWLSAHTFNPMQVELVEGENPVPTTMSLGLRYASTATVRMFLEAQQEWDSGLSIRGGIEYEPLEWLILRAGTMTQPVQFTFGLGIQIDPLWMDLAYAYHPLLGSTPMLSLRYTFAKDKNQQL